MGGGGLGGGGRVEKTLIKVYYIICIKAIFSPSKHTIRNLSCEFSDK